MLRQCHSVPVAVKSDRLVETTPRECGWTDEVGGSTPGTRPLPSVSSMIPRPRQTTTASGPPRGTVPLLPPVPPLWESGHHPLYTGTTDRGVDEQPELVSRVAPLDEGEPRLVAEVELLEEVFAKEQEQVPPRVEDSPLRDRTVEAPRQVPTDVHELDQCLLSLVQHLQVPEGRTQ